MKIHVVPEPSERWTTLILVDGQLDAGVQARDRRVVPGRDLADVDAARAASAVELELAGRDALEVDDRDDAADDHGELHQAVGLEVGLLERRVGGAEVDGLGLDGRDAAARADRLVVELDAGRRRCTPGPTWSRAGAGKLAPAPTMVSPDARAAGARVDRRCRRHRRRAATRRSHDGGRRVAVTSSAPQWPLDFFMMRLAFTCLVRTGTRPR